MKADTTIAAVLTAMLIGAMTLLGACEFVETGKDGTDDSGYYYDTGEAGSDTGEYYY